MKKFLSIAVLLALLLSFCGCQAAPAAETPAPTLDPTSPEALYGHIDQSQPVDGVYKIWNSQGVLQMAEHPDADFELLCNVDMQGAQVKGFDTYTGDFNGANFTISNFTLVCSGENYGFAGINRGKIHNLYLDLVTFAPNADAKNIGTMAGINEGSILRCRITGTLPVQANGANCGSLVGKNSGSLANTNLAVDLTFQGESSLVGGIAGSITGGTVEYMETQGVLTVTGNNQAGLFAGSSENVVLLDCTFLGADNSANGKLFTNFTGNEDDEMVTVSGGLWRDNANQEPITTSQAALRDRAVEAMYAMGSVEWHPNDLIHTCTCQLSGCHGVYNKEYTYYGIPYNHKGGSLARMQYCLNEDGTVKDFVYEMASFDGFDGYMGNDCSTAVQQAWWVVSNSTDVVRCDGMQPCFDKGCYAVGDYEYNFNQNAQSYTDIIINANSEQTMYEAYGQMRRGDAHYYMREEGGHTRMAAEDAVTVRDQNGLINPDKSYVICHEQGNSITDDVKMTTTSWRLNWKYTFSNLYLDWAIPVTIAEFMTGEMEAPTCELTGSVDGKLGMVTGTVKANYYLDYVDLKITDDQGNVVMDHRMFTTVGRYYDHNFNDSIIRNYCDTYDLGHFASPLQNVALEKGRTYSYTITAYLATDDVFTLKEGSFVNGN